MYSTRRGCWINIYVIYIYIYIYIYMPSVDLYIQRGVYKYSQFETNGAPCAHVYCVTFDPHEESREESDEFYLVTALL